MSEISAEATGETVGEAKWAALRELEQQVPGLDRDAVRFQVVTEGERGLLGVGYTPARVIASVEAVAAAAAGAAPPRPADQSDEGALTRELLERCLSAIGVKAGVSVEETGSEIRATVTGPELGLVIGRHGQTIDALQYLANAISHRAFGEDKRHVTVDAAGYRERRTVTLVASARRSAERAAATGRRVELDPMTAVERKIVHEALKDDPSVETASEGTEPNRFVVISPSLRPD
jgi:spoIIIJ-associated protein